MNKSINTKLIILRIDSVIVYYLRKTDNNSIFNMESLSGAPAAFPIAQLLPAKRRRSRKKSPRIPNIPPCSSLENTLDQMKTQLFQQSQTAVALLTNYQESIASLQKKEQNLVTELQGKGINPADPNLQVSEVFSVAKSRSRLRHTGGDRQKVSELKILEIEEAPKSLEIIGAEMKESNETSSKSDGLENYQVNENYEEIQNDYNRRYGKLEINEEQMNLLNSEEFDMGEKPEIRGEQDLEKEIPNVPLAISQVFL